MPSTYTTNLGIEKIATGEQSGTWGTTTNTNFDLIDTAVNGIVSITLASAGTSGSPNDLPITDGTASNGRNKFIEFVDGGDLGATAYVQLTPNDAEKIVHIRNSLSGSRSIIVFQGTYNASNDFEIANGADVTLKFDGGGTGATVTDVNVDLTVTGATIATADINGGAIDGTVIGGSSAAAGTFTTFTSTGIDDNAVSTAITIDSSQDVTFTSDAKFPDSGKAIFGAGSDLQIYHDGSNSYIRENGTGLLYIGATDKLLIQDSTLTNTSAKFDTNADVSLYYNNDKRLETTSTGIDVTGDVNSDSVTTGTFTSTGIDDNATSTAITIDSSQNTTFAGTITSGDITISEGTPLLRIQDTDGTNQYTHFTNANGNTYFGSRNDTADGNILIGGYGGNSFTEFARWSDAGHLTQKNNLIVQGAFTSLGIDDNASSTVMTIASSGETTFTGDVVISEATPSITLDDSDNADGQLQIVQSTGSSFYRTRGVSGNGAHVFQRDDGTTNLKVFQTNTSGDVVFYENDGSTEGMRWDASASSLGIGTSDPSDGKLQIAASATAGVFVRDSSSTGAAPYIRVQGQRQDVNTSSSFSGGLVLERYRTDAAIAPAASDSSLGTIYFGGNHTDGSESNIAYSASIVAKAEGTFNSASDMPTGLAFFTGSTGRDLGTANVSFGTERMRIDSSGNVGIGATTINRKLELSGNNNGGAKANYLRITDTDTSATLANQQGGIEFYTSDSGNEGVTASMEVVYAGSGGGGEFTFNTAVSGGTGVTEAMRIDNAGNVGIGTTNPATTAKLTISDASNAAISIDNPSGRAYELISTSTGNFGLLDRDAVSYRLLVNSSGHTGIGTTDPQMRLHVAENNSGGTTDVARFSNSQMSNSFNAGAKISIGDDTLASRQLELSLEGNGSSEFYAYVRTREAGGPLFLGTATVAEAVTVASAGNVGIGTTSPNRTLDIKGANPLNINTTSNNHIHFQVNDVTTGQYVSTSSLPHQLCDSTGAVPRLVVDSNGRVQIGTTSSSIGGNATGFLVESSVVPGAFYRTTSTAGAAALFVHSDVGGTATRVFNVAADGDVTNVNNSYGAISDERLKSNIVDASSQIDDIMAVQVRSYTLDSTGDTHIGVVAQELEASGMSALVKENEDGMKSVKYSVLYMKAIKALQEAVTRIETLEAEVTALKGA